MIARGAALATVLAAVLAGGGPAPEPAGPEPATRTGKERLGPKWADAQRVDDCGVPEDRRDPTRPRPDCDQPALADKEKADDRRLDP